MQHRPRHTLKYAALAALVACLSLVAPACASTKADNRIGNKVDTSGGPQLLGRFTSSNGSVPPQYYRATEVRFDGTGAVVTHTVAGKDHRTRTGLTAESRRRLVAAAREVAAAQGPSNPAMAAGGSPMSLKLSADGRTVVSQEGIIDDDNPAVYRALEHFERVVNDEVPGAAS